MYRLNACTSAFLSQSAQDFIEETDLTDSNTELQKAFLSQSAQDFIEETNTRPKPPNTTPIPELISSGLH